MRNTSYFSQPISEEIWDRKYKLVTPNPDIPDDLTVQDTWRRIANACANAPIEHWDENGDKSEPGLSQEKTQILAEDFYSALEDFKFLPAGRITAGAGSGRDVTLFNCYVMGLIPDDLGGIFDMLKEAALTMQQGGGIGYDFSSLRPSGAPVKGVDADASGPLSFMDVWDAMCRTIMSAGARRGAMMATMRDDHPDIMDFITAKHKIGRLNMFNMSVLVSDEFMAAVKADDYWYLKHEVAPAEPVEVAVYDHEIGGQTKMITEIDGRHIYTRVSAREMWDAIMQNTYDHAEPGVLFVSRINKQNNLWHIEDITATNPCGEQPLPPYGACLLGSLNLTRFVKDAFTGHAHIDYRELEEITRIATRLLDSVVDISNFPLEAQRDEAKFKRRMGIGITGLGDMLFMLNEKYGSKEAAEIAENVMRTITLAAYWESIQMAREYGPCPATKTFEQRRDFVASGFMRVMPSEMKDAIMQTGIRNTHLTSIAPTGTISMYAGNVSSGVEPIFATSYNRNVLEDDGVTKVKQRVEDYGFMMHREYCESLGLNPEEHLGALVTAQTLSPEDHLLMQAAVQPWIDSSISKTINCPVEISFEDFKAVYDRAYDLGLKGCTTYRPNDTLGTVLEIEETPSETPEPSRDIEEVVTQIVDHETPDVTPGPAKRKGILDAKVYKLKWKNANVYVTISNQRVGGKLVPFEIFINTQDMSNFQYIVALTRMMSSVMRRGEDISFVITDLKSIMDPNGGEFVGGRYQPSFMAYLGQTLERHIDGLNGEESREETLDRMLYLKEEDASEVLVYDDTEDQPGHYLDDPCPECKAYAMVNRGGCPICDDCGHSKCG